MGKIALLVSREEMLHLAHNIMQERDYDISEMRVIRTDQAVIEARNSIAAGASIIIARGLQASLIKQYTDIPVVEIVVTAQEMALLVMKAKQIVKKPRPVIAVVGFKNMLCDMSYFETIYDIELRTYVAPGGNALRETAMMAVEDQADLIIGGDTAVTVATENRVPSLFLSITEDSLRTAFAVAESMNYAMGMEKRNAAQIETLLDYSFGGVVNMDHEGRITMVNPVMEELLGKKEEEIKGQLAVELFREIGRDKMNQILADGRETYSLFMQINRTPVFAILAPVQIDGRVDGAILSCHKMKRNRQETERRGKEPSSGLVALGNFQDLLQQSKAMQDCIHKARLYSQSVYPVLLTGEAGTEKKLLAESIHNNSLCSDGPFVTWYCGDGDEERVRSGLFGEKGAAVMADGGTLYLEDIGRLSLTGQYLLYRLIRQHLCGEGGGRGGRYVSVRILAGAEAPLGPLVEGGRFRKDLFYLLQALKLEVPPLRERPDDLRQLLADCIKRSDENFDLYHVLTQGAWDTLLSYPWPGNLPQAESFCECLVLSAGKRSIDEVTVRNLLDSLYPVLELGQEEGLPGSGNPRWEGCEEAELIRETLVRFGGSREKTAAQLGISKATLWRRMNKYGIR